MHTCDNPPCINPAHLKQGTHADNVADRDKKNRIACGDENGARLYPERVSAGAQKWRREKPEEGARGERVNTAKLTENDVILIRQRYGAGGIRQQDLADEYGVTQVQISSIVRGESWAHVPLYDE
jgi:hypothetical protein